MATLLLIIHLAIAIALIIIVLLQRSEGGALGIGGPGNMSGRSSANLLTRTTAVLAAGFFLTSIALTILARTSADTESKLDAIKVDAPKETGKVLDQIAPVTPKQPEGPVVPKPE